MSAPATPRFHRWNIEVRLESQQNTLTNRLSVQIPQDFKCRSRLYR